MNRYLVDEAILRALLDDALFLRSLHKDTEERSARSEAAITATQAILCAPPPTCVEIDPTTVSPLPFGSHWGSLTDDYVPNRPGVAALGTKGYLAPIKPHKADE